MEPGTPAAWKPDPTGRHELRYWDGEAWTANVSDHGTTATDPLVPPAPTPEPEPEPGPGSDQGSTTPAPPVDDHGADDADDDSPRAVGTEAPTSGRDLLPITALGVLVVVALVVVLLLVTA